MFYLSLCWYSSIKEARAGVSCLWMSGGGVCCRIRFDYTSYYYCSSQWCRHAAATPKPGAKLSFQQFTNTSFTWCRDVLLLRSCFRDLFFFFHLAMEPPQANDKERSSWFSSLGFSDFRRLLNRRTQTFPCLICPALEQLIESKRNQTLNIAPKP